MNAMNNLLANPEYVREDIEVWKRETNQEAAPASTKTAVLYYTEFEKERIAEAIERRKKQFGL